MRRSQYFLFFLALMLSFNLNAQDSAEATGFDGDNFSLEGAIEFLKNSSSLEEFEKSLNTEDNYVNNLDLNRDGDIDYVMVKDNYEGKVHAIVLQVAVNKNEDQDIAVIEIEKTGDDEATLQIIGDEEVFGEQHIVEPFDMEGSSEGSGPSAEMHFTRIVVNVWFWPSVRYIYRPSYRVWVSPWHWGYYPKWWRPWRPRTYTVFRPLTVRYHSRCHRVTTHRVVNAHKIYVPKRKTSTTVVSRTKVTRTKITTTNSGSKKVVSKSTSTNKSATGPKGNTVSKSNHTKTTAIKSADGTKKAAMTKSKSQAAAKSKGGFKKAGVKKTTTTKKAKTSKGKAGVKKSKTVKSKKKG